MKQYPRLIFVSVLCCALALLMAFTGADVRFGAASSAELKGVVKESVHSEPHQGYEAEKPVLLLYSPGRENSEKYVNNLCGTLSYLKWEYEKLDISRTESVSYHDYSMVVIATDNMEQDMTDDARRILNYVADGGQFFFGMVQHDYGRRFQSIYHNLGIHEYTDYEEYDGMYFNEDLLVGTAGQTLQSEELSNSCLRVSLQEDARVYLSVYRSPVSEERTIPLFWTFDYKEGRVGVLKASFAAGDFFKGVLSGCLQAVRGTSMYPVINASCVFIDDFPAPQYDIESDVILKNYHRSVTEFYRDIWWPDMQKAASLYDVKYTGLFVATYDDVVDPEKFSFAEQTLMRYYGDSLLRGGHEMGAHGYNHQSLAEAGQVPEELGYNSWKSLADMTAAVTELRSISEDLFPYNPLTSYVPPSNYLSDLGREAVKTALPDLKTISGLYTSEGEEGSVYCTRFEAADDGIVDFPRVTSGMKPTQYETLAWQSALTLHGVFSHFIHPDDILDPERSYGADWETLIDGFEELLADVNASAAGLRQLTASQAADAVHAYEDAKPYLTYEEDKILCTVDNFHGEVYFYLRTDAEPVAADENCTVTCLDADGEGHYYVVCAKSPKVTILLKGGD